MDEKPPFLIGALIGGIAVSLVAGVFLILIGALAAQLTSIPPIAFLIGAIPGGIIIWLARSASKDGFAQGLIIGGCIVALIGGMCGAGFLEMKF